MYKEGTSRHPCLLHVKRHLLHMSCRIWYTEAHAADRPCRALCVRGIQSTPLLPKPSNDISRCPDAYSKACQAADASCASATMWSSSCAERIEYSCTQTVIYPGFVAVTTTRYGKVCTLSSVSAVGPCSYRESIHAQHQDKHWGDPITSRSCSL